MNDSKPGYGNLLTGKFIPAHEVARKNEGDISEEQLETDMQVSIDPNVSVPGIVTADGRFHPRDQSKLPPSGKWIVEFRDLGQALIVRTNDMS
jgi:hypothetical protein